MLVGRRTRPIAAIAAALICWTLWGVPLRAEDSVRDDATAEAGAAETGSANPAGGTSESGPAVPSSEPEFWEQLEEEFSPSEDESPIAPVYISELSLDGVVEGDQVRMTASIIVEVTTDNVPFDIPLRLNQAHVTSMRYEGPGRAAPITEAQRDDGLHWQFEGRGTHHLHLAFRVTLKNSLAGHQLLLTLPELPRFLVSQVRLRIPGDQIVVRAAPGMVAKPPHEGMTEIDAEVDGQRLELTWTESPQRADTRSSVRTTATIQREDERLVLMTRQTITVEQGQLSELQFRLPTGFQVEDVSLTGPDGPANVMFTPLVEDSGWVRVVLPDPSLQEFALEWRLSRPFPAEGGVIGIDGLEIRGAIREHGEIVLEDMEGYRVNWNEKGSRGFRRISESARGTTSRAYQFLSTPFRLEIDIRPISAQTDVQTTYYLHVEGDELVLVLDASVQIRTGPLHELRVVWPDQPGAKWSILADHLLVTSNDNVIAAELNVDAIGEGAPPVLTMTPPASGTLRVRLRFSRTFPPDEGSADVTLPRIDATWPVRPTLFVGESIDVTTKLKIDPEPRSAIEADTGLPDALHSGFDDVRMRGWKLSKDTNTLHIDRTSHQQTVAVSTAATVSSPADTSVLQVVEDFSYEVNYGRIKSMLFEVPAEILQVYNPGGKAVSIPESSLRFLDGDGNRLERVFEGGHLRVSLPTARYGVFPVRLEFALPLAEFPVDGGAGHELPLVQPLDANVTRTSVHADPTSSLDITVLDPAWQNLPNFAGGTIWQIGDRRDGCPLELQFAAREFAQRLKISSCYLQTKFDQGGAANTWGVYVLEHPPEELLVSLPDGHMEPEFRWNGRPLAPDRESDAARYILDLRDAGDAGGGRLVVNYRVDVSMNGGATVQAQVEFPSFGPDVRIDETIWEVELPPRYLLSEAPETMSPEYQWQRRAMLWMRLPTDYVRRRRHEIVGDIDDLPALTENRYAFSTTGNVTQAQIGSMTQSFLVLLGAGTTLLLGFVFGRVPAARNMYSLLVLAFLLSVGAVWSLDLIQLLIQPALIGLCLAILAVTFDTATRSGPAAPKNGVSVSGGGSGVESAEPQSSVHSSVSSRVARTALFRGVGSSESGGHPHE